MVRALSKVYAFLNSKLDQIVLLKPLEIKPLHKGMAETDVSHEFGTEPGFSSSVFGPERSHMLHIHEAKCHFMYFFTTQRPEHAVGVDVHRLWGRTTCRSVVGQEQSEHNPHTGANRLGRRGLLPHQRNVPRYCLRHFGSFGIAIMSLYNCDS